MKRWQWRKFAPAGLAEYTGPDTNPGRGWYQMVSFDISSPVNLDALKESTGKQDRLVMVLINIGSCRNRDLTEEMLTYFRRILAFFPEQGQEMIVRIAYDTEGKGLEREPDSLEQVLRHMRQIGPVLRQFSGQIHTLQGLFVGSWGEMHGSRYLSDEGLRLLAETMWDAVGGSCYLAVRTPRQRRILERSKIDPRKVGLFVDGLFGSETHLGTFGVEADPAVRERAWLPEKELAYLNTDCARMPNGGETVLGEWVPTEQVIQTLESMHLTYLNRGYDARLLNLWKQAAFRDGQNLYDYVGSHLGYRFVLKNVRLKTGKGKLTIVLSGENNGFGNLLRESQVWLNVFQNGDICFRRRLDADPRQWDSKKEFICKLPLPGHSVPRNSSRPYELYVTMRKRDGEIIRFANAPMEDMVFLGSVFGWKMEPFSSELP